MSPAARGARLFAGATLERPAAAFAVLGAAALFTSFAFLESGRHVAGVKRVELGRAAGD